MNEKDMFDEIIKIIDKNWLYAAEYQACRTVDSLFYGINKKDKYARILKKDDNVKSRSTSHVKSKFIKGILFLKINYIDEFCINELKQLLKKNSMLAKYHH